jgi:WD40 repeat protein
VPTPYETDTHFPCLLSFEFSPDSSQLLVASQSSPILSSYALDSRELTTHLRIPGRGISDFSISQNGKTIALSCLDSDYLNHIEVADFSHRRMLRTFNDNPLDRKLAFVQLSSDGKKVLVRSAEEFVLWNHETGGMNTVLRNYSHVIIVADQVYFKTERGLGRMTVKNLFHAPHLSDSSTFIDDPQIVSFSVGEKYLGVLSIGVDSQDLGNNVLVASVFETKSGELAFRMSIGRGPCETNLSLTAFCEVKLMISEIYHFRAKRKHFCCLFPLRRGCLR